MLANTQSARHGIRLFLLLMVGVVPSIHAQSKATETATIAAHIARVENGLRGPVAIKGEPLRTMALADRMRALHIPGVSIAVINHGSIEWARGYGVADAERNNPVTADTMFQVASISKNVSAAAILTLVQQGKLGLDDNVNGRLTSWKLPVAAGVTAPVVTVRQLLSHTGGTTVGGFAGYTAAGSLPGLRAILNGEKPANSPPVIVDQAPGQAFRYSGGGYTVLQQMVEDMTGTAFDKFMQARVLGPLNMRHSTFAQPLPARWQAAAASAHDKDGAVLPGKWHTYPTMAAAGLWSMPSDMARYVIALQQASAGKPGTLLSKPMADAMLTPVMNKYGLGTVLEAQGDQQRFSHSGGNAGIRSMMVGYTHKGQGAVILTNGDNGSVLIDELLRAIAAEYQWDDYAVVEHTLVPAAPQLFARYAGRFQAPNRTFAITARENRLFVQEPSLGAAPIELLPASDTQYFALEAKLTLTFLPQADGKVDAVDVDYFGKRQAVRID